MKNKIFAMVMIGFLYLIIEGFALSGLNYLNRAKNVTFKPVPSKQLASHHRKYIQKLINGENEYLTHSPDLGWTVKPSGKSEKYRANAAGFRAAREYKAKASPGVLRIATFGDSFTHGDEVNNAQTWQALLSGMRPQTEVLNFGVSGYGLDQAFLRYQQDGVKYHPDIVIVGYVDENSLRLMTTFRPFYLADTALPLSKPRFALVEGKLVLHRNILRDIADYERLLNDPVPYLEKLGEHDYYYQNEYHVGALDYLPSVRLAKIFGQQIKMNLHPEQQFLNDEEYLNLDFAAFRLTLRLIEHFCATVRQNGSQPLVLIYPQRVNMTLYRSYQMTRYEPILRYFEENGIPYLDLMQAFLNYGEDRDINEWLSERHHYSPLGQQIVAQYMADYLGNQDLE